MSRLLPEFMSHIRHVLLGLFAVLLVVNMGVGCEALAATPMPYAHQAHCADVPAKPDKPLKTSGIHCALCAALPDIGASAALTPSLVSMAPIAGTADRLASLAGGPAPPPPRIA